MGGTVYKDNIVMDMDDGSGPRPFKGSMKRRTGAEQFEVEHQQAIEAYVKPSGDRVSRVNQHNSAYPKLKDELDRRQSIIKVTSINRKALKGDYDSYCNACARQLNLRASTKVPVKPRCSGHVKPHHNRRASKRRRSRVTKSKPKRYAPRKHARSRSQRYPINRGCQCSSLALPHDATDPRDPNSSKNLADHSREPSNEYTHEDTEASKMSSYHSFISMDQEPMVK